MKPSAVLLSLLCCVFFALAACNDNHPEEKKAAETSAETLAEEQAAEKYKSYRQTSSQFLGDFASRYRQMQIVIQENYDFSAFHYFSDDLEVLKNNLEKTLALPGSHALDAVAQDYLDAISALLPLDQKLSAHDQSKNYLTDGGARIGQLCRQLLPLLKAAAKAQQRFTRALQQEQDSHLLATINKYPDGIPQKYRIRSLYYARRIHHGFAWLFAHYDAKEDTAKIKNQLVQDITDFDKNTRGYLAIMPENTSCSAFMNTLVDLLGESRSMLENFERGDYFSKPSPTIMLNTALIQRNNDWSRLKRRYGQVIESYNQGGC